MNKINRSLLADILANGIESWSNRAGEALEDKYYFEVIAICFNCINIVLRDSIRMTVQKGHYSPYLDLIFNDYDNPLIGKIADRSIYDEASRLQIIDKDTCKQLHELHNKRNELFHRLFQNKSDGYTEENESYLKDIATECFWLQNDLVAAIWPIEGQNGF
jgi:hypothetical protein